MIVWINGPFGGGKTTLSERLKALLPASLIFDPEEIGYALRHLGPASPTGDFQDLPIWRTVTLHALLEVRRLYGQTVIVPMTLVNPAYLAEIIGGLTAAGEDLRHVFLDIDAQTLRQRILGQVLVADPVRDQEARQFRLAHVDRCLAVREEMPAGTIVLDSGLLGPAELAAEVLSRLKATSGTSTTSTTSEAADQGAAAAGGAPGTGSVTDVRLLAAQLFNETWRLMNLAERTRPDDDRMIHTAHASRCHWGQVPAATPAHLARGEWQISRVYTVLRRAEPALHHAARVLDICQENGIGDWDLAFAYEALARAHAVAGNAGQARAYTDKALAAARDITDAEDRDLVLADLETIPGQPRYW